MNEKRELPVGRALALAAALLLLAACRPSEPPPLAGAAIGGPFALTDQDGRTVRDSDFAGRYRLFYFGFTYCPDVCPVDLRLIGEGLRRLERADPRKAAKVQPIFVSVDPARDRPEVLKPYVAAFHPRLIGLTGSDAAIGDMARRYGVYFAARDARGGSGYLVDHSRVATLYGPDGAPIAIIPHDQGADAVAAELERWVR